MQFVISSLALGELRKSQNSLDASPLKGARRVGGHGASHEGSHWEKDWLREAATVKSALGDYGVRDGIVVARQTNQLKIWAPGLGMFVVDASAASPSDATVQWDRKKAEVTLPVPGSLVNVRREGDKSQWFARLEESLDAKAPGDTVMVSRGTLGRKMEKLEVPRVSILGPHIPTKIKDADGAFVKDATSRRSAAPSRLQEVLAPAAKWRDAPAIEWVHSLKRGRREQILAGEAEWFKAHQDDVVRLAVAQAIRAGLHDPAQVEDVVSEAFYGALSGLRLWAKRPARQRAMMQRKMLERMTPAQVENLSDEELRTQRALMRAFAKARAAVIPGEEEFIDAGALDWEEMPDQDAERAGTPIYDGGGENYAATVIQTEVADAAKLSPAARFLLSHAIDQGWALNGEGLGPPPDEAGEIAQTLREQHGVVHASAENVPGMWLFVKNRLRDAVKADPALLSTLHVPRRGRDQTLAKSLFTSEMVAALDADGRTQRISAIFRAFESSFEKGFGKFDPLKHPHGALGRWANVFHNPSDDLFGSPPVKGLSPAVARAVTEFSAMLDKIYQAPGGYSWTVRPEHFVKLVCGRVSGDEGKGRKEEGQSDSRTFYDLRDGIVNIDRIPGFQPNRAAHIHLAPIVVSDPDFILVDKHGGRNDRLFYRRFVEHGRLVWVGMIVGKVEKKLTPLSFYDKENVEGNARFEPEWSAPGLTWRKNYTPRS